MRAVILAGGKGTRLQPLTFNFPKPLVPIGGMPVLEILLRRLVKAGIVDVTLTLGYLAELVKAFLSEHRALSDQLNLSYVHEDRPTGTAGSLALVDGLQETFLVMNGDLLTNLNFDSLIRHHHEEGAALTIATTTRREKMELGVVKLGHDNIVVDYIEKPQTLHTVSMGVYVYEPRVLSLIETGRYLDFPTLVLRLLEAGEKVVSYASDDMWLDIGRPDDYAAAQELYAEHREELDVV